VLRANGTNYQYLAFNMEDPVFSDLRVRQAIAYAIDRDRIIKYLWRDQARPATGVIPPGNWSYEPNVTTYSYNPEKARQLLRESGHANLSFTFRSSNSDESRLLAAVLQQQLKDVGINMEIRSNEFATFFADIQKGNFQAYSARWIGANNEPDHFGLIFHSGRTPPNGANRGRYSNPEVDRLIEMGRREADNVRRKPIYQRIQQIVSEDLPYVSLWYLDNVAVFNKRIHGMTISPAGDYDFLNQITLEP
jgi:peptide/nickel transport system substrate-binding protein